VRGSGRRGSICEILATTSQDIYPLARQLYDAIPEHLRRWTGELTGWDERICLGYTLLTVLTGSAGAHSSQEDEAGRAEAVIISEALANVVTDWGGSCYLNCADDVDRAQEALARHLGAVVQGLNRYTLAVGTPITVPAIAYLIGWVTFLDVPEGPSW
jgi:hypothetical protein